MCIHLDVLEKELVNLGVTETFRGKAWSKNCREWIYYDCLLNTKSLMKRLQLPAFIEVHTINDNKRGLEHGLVCTMCQDAIMGLHPDMAKGKRVVR